MTRRLSRILVANRGEIACRVIRTARSLGLSTVAVHSDADVGWPHTRLADDAVRIGPAPAAESYLSIGALIDAARQTGCDGLHPGYGFLSENPLLAEACAGAGLIFVGPPAEAMRAMGDKAEARRLMAAAGVPVVPGFDEPGAGDETLIDVASAIGFPLMVKAAAGGGGRGMRVVHDEADLPAALTLARAESKAAFGSDALILERALFGARHVEVQVFADAHGSVIHLGERDCSVQRRHQKVIEEAPSPAVDEPLREALGAAAVRAARAIDYRGAGTVEFLLDASGDFHFLEMNTRLQVEHPVTEAITGLDLVALQFQVAEGKPLGLAQADIRRDGHAIEVRLYAEDPENDFLPVTGPVLAWEAPTGEGVRVDAGIETGVDVGPHYDPMLGKLVAHGPTRDVARRRLKEALGRTVCFGVGTNRDFLLDLLDTAAFSDGECTTTFLETNYPDGVELSPIGTQEVAAAAVLDVLDRRDRALSEAVAVPAELLAWSSAGQLQARAQLHDGTTRWEAAVTMAPRGPWTVRVDDAVHEVLVERRDAARATLSIDGAARSVAWWAGIGALHVADDVRSSRFERVRPGRRAAFDAAASGSVKAPLHGLIAELRVGVGDSVSRGDTLLVLEAMKMQHELPAQADGVVRTIRAKVGEQVAAGVVLIELEEES